MFVDSIVLNRSVSGDKKTIAKFVYAQWRVDGDTGANFWVAPIVPTYPNHFHLE